MSNFYSTTKYRKTQANIARENWEHGKYNSLISPLEKRICKNPSCNLVFHVKPYVPNVYCSHSCSATISNRARKKDVFCLACGIVLVNSQTKYCSFGCQMDYKYKKFINKWLSGQINGGIGITSRTLSGHIRKYLFSKFQSRCAVCGWNKLNPVTGKIPLEIDHVDGNSENNKEENLRLICPNCHALSPNFRALNRGNGRKWRTTKLKTLAGLVKGHSKVSEIRWLFQ